MLPVPVLPDIAIPRTQRPKTSAKRLPLSERLCSIADLFTDFPGPTRRMICGKAGHCGALRLRPRPSGSKLETFSLQPRVCPMKMHSPNAAEFPLWHKKQCSVRPCVGAFEFLRIGIGAVIVEQSLDGVFHPVTNRNFCCFAASADSVHHGPTPPPGWIRS